MNIELATTLALFISNATYAQTNLNTVRNAQKRITQGLSFNGDSKAVLNYGEGVGHSALLIQNDEGKWAYYSYNGDWIYDLTKKIGGKNYHDKGNKVFNRPQDFLESEYNSTGSVKQVENDEVNNYGYKEAYILPTTRKQDKAIRDSFIKETTKNYNLLTHQCAQVVVTALESGGINLRNTAEYFDRHGRVHISTPKAQIPADVFSTVRNNEKGQYIKIKKKL